MSIAFPLRLAMWSGPRNISTALMRSWGNRPDTAVVDEPFYGCHLKRTGLPHPIAEEIVARMESDWRKVADALAFAPVPGGRGIFYQKHMAHHFTPSMGGGWLAELTHCFLIRDPAEMLLSLDKVTPNPSVEDTGLPQQWALFNELGQPNAGAAPVIDSRDVLENPEGMLRALCGRLGIPFLPQMLSWPPGPRDSDGIWAPHWYANVEKSTGFQPYQPKEEELPKRLEPVLEECREYHARLLPHKLAPAPSE